nr:histidine kinase [uncultured Sphaerochaeta sp.]
MDYSIHRSRLIPGVSIFLLILFAILQFELSFSELVAPIERSFDESPQFFPLNRWRLQRHVLLVVMACLGFFLAISQRKGIQTFLFILQTIGFGITLFADTFPDFSALTLFIAMCLELHLITNHRIASTISLGYGFALVLFPRVESSWYFISIPLSSEKRLALAFYALLFIIILHLYHKMLEELEHEKASNNYLKRSVVELSSANVGFQNYASRAKEVASREERNRIIREVHDSTGYTLTNITMMMEAAKSLIYSNPAKLMDILTKTKEISQSSLQQIRKTLRILGKEKEQVENPLHVLHRIFTTFEQATNVRVQVEYRNIGMAPQHLIDATLFRIVQESLTNAFWHGEATQVSVQFRYEEDEGLTAIIADNGKGAATISEGIGLKSMREQLNEIGGLVTIQTIKGSGFQLNILIPNREL